MPVIAVHHLHAHKRPCARIWVQSTRQRDHVKPLTQAPLAHYLLAEQQLQQCVQHAKHTLLLLHHTHHIQGFALCTEQDDVATLHYLAVDSKYWNQGIAGQLLGKLPEHAQSLGWQQLMLEVYLDNLSATRLYKRYGWHETGNPRTHPRTRKLLQAYQLILGTA